MTSDCRTFAEFALDLHEADGAADTVERIVHHSRHALGSDEAGVLLIHARKRLEIVASTSPDVTKAHLLQVELDEGPCLEASEEPNSIFRIDDTRGETRWPLWCTQVVELGFRSVLAMPLATRSRRYGSLNLYARRVAAFDESDEAVAAILARHASVALATSHNIEGLQIAVDARKTVGIAMGILMARYGLESDVAFGVLRRFSDTQNLKLRVVAERIITDRGIPSSW